jgi:hypothetical protein|tara:strand:- start:105 stop:374 length:270 start_codon:yes stop_codon:yes gene_type:complete
VKERFELGGVTKTGHDASMSPTVFHSNAETRDTARQRKLKTLPLPIQWNLLRLSSLSEQELKSIFAVWSIPLIHRTEWTIDRFENRDSF